MSHLGPAYVYGLSVRACTYATNVSVQRAYPSASNSPSCQQFYFITRCNSHGKMHSFLPPSDTPTCRPLQ